MIRITQDSANTVYFSEEHTKPFLLFVASNRAEDLTVKWIGTDDASDYPFIISTLTETSSPTATNAEVKFTRKGGWNLSVYEQTNGTNLDVSNATFLVTEPIYVV